MSRVARVCQGNPIPAYSYTEVPFECRHNGVVYGVLQSATLTHVGSRLARRLGLADVAPATDNEHVVVAVFAMQNSSTWSNGGQRPTGSGTEGPSSSSLSSMCVFPVVEMRRKFTETIQNCFRGIGNIGPDHIFRQEACRSSVSDVIAAGHMMPRGRLGKLVAGRLIKITNKYGQISNKAQLSQRRAPDCRIQ